MSFGASIDLNEHEELTLALTHDPVHRVSPGRRRHDDRERRPAVDPERPRLLTVWPGVGHQRLPDRLRRITAARGPARRFARPQTRLPRGPRHLHLRFAS